MSASRKQEGGRGDDQTEAEIPSMESNSGHFKERFFQMGGALCTFKPSISVASGSASLRITSCSLLKVPSQTVLWIPPTFRSLEPWLPVLPRFRGLVTL